MDPETKEATNPVPEEVSKKQEENILPIGDTVEQIYNEIEEKGKKLTSSLSSYWNSFQAHVLPSHESTSNLFETLGKKTELYINELDEDLLTIQNTTTSYLKKIGSFWDQSEPETKSEPVDSNSNSDAQLKTLNSSRDLYLIDSSTDKQFLAFKETFKYDGLDVQKTKKLYLQDGDKPLAELIKDLVPEKMSEEAFWAKYFYMRQKIGRPTDKDDGKSSPLPPKKEEVEDFKWDDSDEESEFAIVQKPNVELTEEGEVLKEDETEADSEKKDVVKETTKTKEEAGTAIVTPSSTTKPTTEKAVKTETKPDAKKDEDDDDDDWE
ncbi:BA75_01591T0 [Komagataella pastoris]|uniref:BA75_01591T0 n=1 Tax=Komagataella pastoris TaxID=4922 RepID=A0A1B2J824_PICPA|nr:BA75_01591T0 [Komagataella pastoris]